MFGVGRITGASAGAVGRGGVGNGNNEVEGTEDGGEVGSSGVACVGGDGGSTNAILSSTLMG